MKDLNRVRLATLLEAIYIENHPDRRASGWYPQELISWGVRMGLISKQEAEHALHTDAA